MRKLSSRKISLLLTSIAVLLVWTLISFKTPQVIVSQPDTIIVSPTSSPEPSLPHVLSETDSTLFPVVKVVDGDTITVRIGDKNQSVRLIGVNTPETVDPRKGVECFGKQASDFAKSLMTGKRVTMQADTTQQDRDRYNRLLRYVYLEDGTFVNKKLVLEGYAYEYTYDEPYVFQAVFKEAEKAARDEQKGLWGYGSCGG